MSKTGLRKINIAGDTYLWRVGHYHLEEFEYSECVDRVTIYLEGYKNAPLILHFRLEDNVLLSQNSRKNDWFIDWGCLTNKERTINLNRPGVIAKLIAYYIAHSWTPKEEKRSLEIKDALKLLDLIELPEGMT
ncbi:MAG: hypothetical protein JKY54_15915 [Flavobacteriales bacterium]|nr:hypothetical protein [Flavobacteriales bacterium]